MSMKSANKNYLILTIYENHNFYERQSKKILVESKEKDIGRPHSLQQLTY